MGRGYLKGLAGDAMNVILAAAGANFRKLLRLLPCAWRRWLLEMIRNTLDPIPSTPQRLAVA